MNNETEIRGKEIKIEKGRQESEKTLGRGKESKKARQKPEWLPGRVNDGRDREKKERDRDTNFRKTDTV